MQCSSSTAVRRASRRVVGNVKAAVAREARQTGLWQRGFHDHVIRDDDDLQRVHEYIADNPRRWAERRLRV
jgi:hypothetical protein